MSKIILVTGGAGYIGSHTVVELVNSGYQPIIIDNFSNSNPEVLNRLAKITGKKIRLYKNDVRDDKALDKIFSENNVDAVIHFAGLKAVGESVIKPLEYYDYNINTMLSVLRTMRLHKVMKLIFSSSATVYGNPSELPLKETSQVGIGITNPYSQTKFMIEQILKDLSIAYPEMKVGILRYFNPIGAHESGLIGEDPLGIPNNLMPYISQVAVGKQSKLSIFGNDYSTSDGTCMRDYIHVVDLAHGHVATLKNLKYGTNSYNLGSGKPTSVLELVNTFIKTTGQKIDYEFVARRSGDIDIFYADPTKAKKELDWKTRKTIEDACRDSWNWQSKNPNGFNE